MDIATMTDEVIGWLAEVGVRDADESTVVSSLDLTWILHRFEESTQQVVDLSDEELLEVTTLHGLATVLERVKKRGLG